MVIVLFDNPLNNFDSIRGMDFVGILYFSINIESIKQYMNSESMRAQKCGFWI